MQSFFWHVLSDPRVHKLLAAEIRGAVAAGAVPAEGNLTWAQSQSLPYLQACLKEAMRVRPAVGLNITRVVPPEGVELAGEFFAGGTTVAVNGWVLHRDRETFGEDCEVFRPERWLEGEEKARVMERYMFQVSCSRQTCSPSLPLLGGSKADGDGASLVVGRMSASAGTSRFWRSTRSSRGSSETSSSSWWIPIGRWRRTRHSSWCRRG